ncbi:MAG: M20 family metallopeptidase [Hyphomicrobiaceae bacterium]
MSAPTADELLEGIRSWVEIESQTADLEGVNRMMDKAAADFSAAGGRVERISGTRGMGDHLLIRSPWGGDGPGVLVLCHLDTVHPRGTLAKLPFRVDGDRAYGPGTYDMKGGAYLALAAFRQIVAEGRTTPLPLRFLYVADEEVGSVTSRAHIEKYGFASKYVLVTEPCRDGGKVVTGRKGTARFDIEAHGRPAHSGSRHQDGRSAIREIARQILDIEAMTDYERGVTTNVGTIEGGTTANTVPAHCRVRVDVRIQKPEDADVMVERIRALKPYDKDVRLEIRGQLNRPPYEKTPEIDALYRHARSIARQELGIELGEVFTGGGSDGNFTAAKVATLDGLGVDGAGGHTLDEHLLVSSLVPRMTLQRRLMETLE